MSMQRYFQENIVSSKSYFKIIPFKVSFSLDAKLLLISDTELLKKWWSWKEIYVKWIFVVVQVELLWYLKKFLSMELVSHRWWQEHWKRNSRWDTCVFILLSNQVQGPYCKLLTKFFFLLGFVAQTPSPQIRVEKTTLCNLQYRLVTPLGSNRGRRFQFKQTFEFTGRGKQWNIAH